MNNIEMVNAARPFATPTARYKEYTRYRATFGVFGAGGCPAVAEKHYFSLDLDSEAIKAFLRFRLIAISRQR